LKFVTYFIAYVIIPIYFFTTGIPNSMPFISKQTIPDYLTRAILTLILIILIFVVYKKVTSMVFDNLCLNLKNEWVEYLTLKDRKIGYYKHLTLIVYPHQYLYNSIWKVFDYLGDAAWHIFRLSSVTLVVFVYFMIASIIWASYNERLFGLKIWENKVLLGYGNNINTDLLELITFLVYSIGITSIILFLVAIVLLYILRSVIMCCFPVIKSRGGPIIDTSDITISFIKNAIDKLDSFNFSDDCIGKQQKRNEITQSISYALNYYVKVDNGKEDPDFTNFCYILWAGHLSPAARKDVLFRTNGLYNKLDELCAKINNMNTPDDRDAIVQGLKMYLKMIEDRDLSKIEGLPYEIKKSNLTALFTKVATFLLKTI
jgi:hypothetical protein